jgi:hypothetical protein
VLQRFIDCHQHTFEVLVDVVIPKTQDLETLLREAVISLRVAPSMRVEIMLTAVDLDDEALLQADEINDEAIARRLPAEMESTLSPGAEVYPQLDLLPGHALAQRTRDFVRHPPPGSLRSPPSPCGGGMERAVRSVRQTLACAAGEAVQTI